MNAQVCKIFYLSLFLCQNPSLLGLAPEKVAIKKSPAKVPLVCVSFSGKQLLDGSVQGKKCKTEISKFEDQV